MKKIDVGQAVSTLANIGVIAGIIFLGIELQQNNELMGYEKRLSSLQLDLTQVDLLMNNTAYRDALMASTGGDSLSVDQAVLIRAGLVKMMRTMEWQYFEVPEDRGVLSSGLGGGFELTAEQLLFYEEIKRILDPEFVSFFEAAVLLD